MTWRSNQQIWVVMSIVLMAFVSPSTAKVIYVDADAPGANNGQDWTNAYKYLQDALADAGSATKPVEIHVAEGIYRPDETSANPNGSGDHEATFQLINEAAIKGGYAGFGEPDANARDIGLYETILSGDLNGNDTDANSAWDLWGDPTRYDNSLHVVTGSGTDDTAVLDGFTISDGYADGTGIDNRGGGMFNDNGNPTLANCTFYANCGGGMYCEAGNPELTNCTFKMNITLGIGGGIDISNCSPTMTGCLFIANAGHNGAGMSNHLSSPNLINCTFYANEAGSVGGGMCTDLSSPVMSNCIFRENTSGIIAGGMYINGGSPILTNCALIKNSALSSGGGVMVNSNTSLTLTNCTFSGNSAMSGSVMENFNSTITLTNCILWDNLPPQIGNYNSTSVVTYSDIQGGWLGLGNIDADPCFVDPNNGDYHLKSQAGRWDSNSQSWVMDYVSSPCIDAGNPGCTEANEPTPNGNRINMGAYGGTAEASKSPAYWRSIADMTNDWIVDSNDLKVFADYWLNAGECLPGDFDRSLFVDFNDFAILGGQWRQEGPGPGITYDIGGCIPVDFTSSVSGDSEPTRFTVTVEGRYIYFEDMMRANCCPEELDVQMTLEDDLITIYEIERFFTSTLSRLIM